MSVLTGLEVGGMHYSEYGLESLDGLDTETFRTVVAAVCSVELSARGVSGP